MVRQYYPSQAYKGATDTTFIATADEDEIDPTVTTYDILDRTLSTTLPNTTVTSMSYDIAGDVFTTTVTTGHDGITRTKTSYRDMRELITRIEEDEGITTTYVYNFLKQIEKVTGRHQDQ